MNPTQSTSWHRHFWDHRDFDYHFSQRFRSPHPAGVGAAESAAATASTQSTRPATHAALEGAPHVSTGGAGGHPPRTPFGVYEHYQGGAYPYRRWGRGGRRPFFGRFAWFAIGIGAATIWHHRHEQRKHDLEKFLTDPKCWSSMHQRSLPPPPPPAAAEPAAFANINPAGEKCASREGHRHEWGGWRARQERYKEESRRLAQAQAAAAEPVASAVEVQDAPDSRSIKEAEERLWNGKNAEAGKAQKKANALAKEYASERLEKLSDALEHLRRTLQDESKSSSEKKLV